MISLLHGENIVQSRKRLNELLLEAKNQGIEIVRLDAPRTSFTEIRQALESGSLFGEKKLVVFENLFSLPKSKTKETILDYLQNGKFDNSLVLWEAKEIKGDLWPQVKKEIFKVSPIIFDFLDSLRPGNFVESLDLFNSLKKSEEPEMIFYMLIRQFKFLIVAKDLGPSGLSGFSPWQQKRFFDQASRFSLAELVRVFRKLLEIDYDLKTSQDPLSLSSRLDLFLSEL